MKRYNVDNGIFSLDEQIDMRTLAALSEYYRKKGDRFWRMCYALKCAQVAIDNLRANDIDADNTDDEDIDGDDDE